MRCVITGATGFIGSHLTRRMQDDGWSITAFSRSASRVQRRLGSEVAAIEWSGGPLEGRALEAIHAADAIFNLAGANLGSRRWTPEYKQQMRSSRIDYTSALSRGIREAPNASSKVLVSGSGVAYYGYRSGEILTEESPAGAGFGGELAIDWEQAAYEAGPAARVVCVRIGITLGHEGALHKILYPLPVPISPWRLGLGGPLGTGKQWLSWIHIHDIVEMLRWAAINPAVKGPVNGTAPTPVTHRDFARAIGRRMHRPAVIPIPAFALRLAAGEFAEELLHGQRAVPNVAIDHGFTFAFPTVEGALADLIDSHSAAGDRS